MPLPQSEAPTSLERQGFRLRRFEVFNWGTFHNRVWGLDLGDQNTLLTGDIGSGKSTLVDAITTLLVPPQKLNYNKAAGAEERERTARTYVLGQYRKERGDGNLVARPLSLRDYNSYSAILGYFFNDDLGQSVTLAAVFWMKDTQGQPTRMYLVADTRMSIAEDIANFGKDINNLRKRLRAMPSVEIYDSFPGYSAAYRRRLGIANEQALDLFNQTVSMKSVGNLTDFVRDHMLQPFAIEARIEALVSHFEDLKRAHEAVVKARRQISLLLPLVADCNERETIAAQVGELRACRDLLRAWFSSRKLELLQKRLGDLTAEVERLSLAQATAEEKRVALQRRRDDLKRDIAQNGGDRIERISREILEKQIEKDRRERRARQYDELAVAVGLRPAPDSDAFVENWIAVKTGLEALETEQAEKQNVRSEADYDFRVLREQHDELEAELRSLRQRVSNIPRHMLDLRWKLCSGLNVGDETLPFAGELIQVRPGARDWEGAIERLLHGFGLSVLVPDTHYGRVAEWVNQNHLSGRLVYYRVRSHDSSHRAPSHSGSILSKVELRSESPLYHWLGAQFGSRFTHVCCDTLEQFRREPLALTRTGQIKGSNEWHEKDDRNRIDDRARYILGWSNKTKIAALEEEGRSLQIQIHLAASKLEAVQADLRKLQRRKDALRKLEVFETFPDLDWKPLVLQIEQLERERRDIESGSDILRLLHQQLAETESEFGENQGALDKLVHESGRATQKMEQMKLSRDECGTTLAATSHESKAKYFPQIERIAEQALTERPIALDSCDARERETREWLQATVDAEGKKIARLGEQIVKAMQAYKQEYQRETDEVDANVEAASEYRNMLLALQSDDLPRFEARFKELLNENTIREVANFQSQLNRERQTIRERIETINHSLKEIDYNPGRYILLEADATPDIEIRQFQDDLRKCTEGTLTGSEDEQYSESKFLQVKGIIERFRGREASTEIDRRWTRKVTDVRYWFGFSATERWKEDNSEFEHYTDSGGKSGGQKEKLAYTVLAASLAYQFGLERGTPRTRSFRFVMIDEAFGRGSDESTRYGLKLFGELDLQLLVVTPLQKIHVIEPYVSGVGFVHIADSKISMLRNLTIEEYRKERAARRA